MGQNIHFPETCFAYIISEQKFTVLQCEDNSDFVPDKNDFDLQKDEALVELQLTDSIFTLKWFGTHADYRFLITLSYHFGGSFKALGVSTHELKNSIRFFFDFSSLLILPQTTQFML